MNGKPILRLMRELARCYQAMEAYAAADIRAYELTPPQFDVIATLGNTPGMTPKELGERTLITKGTLTGVIDRLAAKALVARSPSPRDGRSQIVRLTPAGEKLFQAVFPAHAAYLARAFADFSSEDFARSETVLRTLWQRFAAAGTPTP